MHPSTRDGWPSGAAARSEDTPLTEEGKRRYEGFREFDKHRVETRQKELEQTATEKLAREHDLDRKRRRESEFAVPSERRGKPANIDTSRRSSLQRANRSVEASPRDLDAMDIDGPPRTPGRASSSSWRGEYRHSDRTADSGRIPRDQTRDGEWARRRDSATGSVDARTPSSASINHLRSPAILASASLESSRQHHAPSSLSSELSKSTMAAIGEFTVAYSRYQEARKNLHSAEDQRSKYQTHFSSFPVMRDHYDGDVRKAQVELDKAKEQHDFAEVQLEWYLRGLASDGVSNEAANRLKSTSSISSAAFEKLEGDVRALKELDQKRAAEHQALNEFARKNIVMLSTKHEMLARSQTLLEESQKSLKEDVAGIERKFTNMTNSLELLKEDVMRAEELSVATSSKAVEWKDGLYGDLKDTVQRMEKLKTGVEEYRDGVKKTAQELDTFKQSILKQNADLAKIKYAQSQLPAPSLPAQPIHKNCATKEDMEALRNLIAKTGSLRTSTSPSLPQAPSSNEFATRADVARLDDTFDDLQNYCNESINDSLEQFKNEVARTDRLEHAFDSLLANFHHLQTQQADMNKRAEAITTIVNNHSGFCNAAQHDIKLARNELGGLRMAVTHLSGRMDDWSSKDFYDRLVQQLHKHNPNWFSSGMQLSQISSYCSKLAQDLQAFYAKSSEFETRLRDAEATVAELRPRQQLNGGASTPNGHTPPADDPPVLAGGTPFGQLANEIKKVWTSLETHIQSHSRDIDDFQEFTRKASDKIAEHEKQISIMLGRNPLPCSTLDH